MSIASAVRFSARLNVPLVTENVPPTSLAAFPSVVEPAAMVTLLISEPVPLLSPNPSNVPSVTTPVPALTVRLLVWPFVANRPPALVALPPVMVTFALLLEVSMNWLPPSTCRASLMITSFPAVIVPLSTVVAPDPSISSEMPPGAEAALSTRLPSIRTVPPAPFAITSSRPCETVRLPMSTVPL